MCGEIAANKGEMEEEIFCSKCHRPVAVVQRDGEGRLTIRQGRRVMKNLKVGKLMLTCPAGHQVTVKGGP